MKLPCKLLITGLVLILWGSLQAANLKAIEKDLSDSVITAKITAKITESRNLNPLKISVSTHQGIVSLTGYVKNRDAYVQALRLVNNTKGVKGIRTKDLHIKKVNTVFTDAYITARVEAAVLKAKVLDDESIPLVGINATTTNGVVTLSGTVKKSKSIPAIIKRVSVIHGVKKIISHLQVKKDATA